MDYYSDLEVRTDPQHDPEQRQYAGTAPLAQEQKAIMPDEDLRASAPKIYVPDPTRAPEPVYPDQHLDESGHIYKEVAPGEERVTSETGILKRKVWGLPRRRFFTILAVVCFAILGIVAGVVGGVLSRRHQSSDKPPSETPTTASNSSASAQAINVMDISSLAAANWTDAHGITHRSVFFQDPFNAVITRRWDAVNQTWATDNLTDIISRRSTLLFPAPGTPLTVAALDRPNNYSMPESMHLYFGTPDNQVMDVVTEDPLGDPSNWYNGPYVGKAKVSFLPGSRMAAIWRRSANGSNGDYGIAYQANDGIRVLNSTDWYHGHLALSRGQVLGNATLTFLPQYYMDNLVGLSLISQTFKSEAPAGVISVTTYNKTWSLETTEIIDELEGDRNDQKVIATKWGSWSRNLCYVLNKDGAMKGAWWDGMKNATVHKLPSITIEGGPATTNFSAVAFTLDATFYGITGDEIHEYSVDSSNAALLHHTGRVYPQ
ncbi:hypothetical protein PFICI_08496 [Pestalotiopsis fici W106-1]|uniref:Fucose-specific lectin n=1 Tax=Pestalotiopsis fici (strain W106-1 / CGMCC3.15140) TaxID=1229662 RepID=W3WXQ6_PESFW|nr:uncharacterized protein PFICI_08496 [Pestalotiopsis fici W106-1]ETS78643.1 hypothetical protein PFICI_08496 [Pestalotiopsis fici W106-1]